MGKKVHEEKQQISGDYLYLRSIQGNNTDEHKSWPQMLRMNRQKQFGRNVENFHSREGPR
jgi:hypothetical protein